VLGLKENIAPPSASGRQGHHRQRWSSVQSSAPFWHVFELKQISGKSAPRSFWQRVVVLRPPKAPVTKTFNLFVCFCDEYIDEYGIASFAVHPSI
jgi:hypothetical protein